MLGKYLFSKQSKFKLVMSILVVGILTFGITFSQSTTSLATEVDSPSEDTITTELTTEENNSNQDNTETTTQETSGLDKAKQDALEASRKKQRAQAILDKLKTAKDNLETYIIELDKSINELTIEISHLEKNKEELEESIKETKKNLKLAQSAQDAQYVAMKQRIQMVYESGNKQYMDVLLTATSMTDILNKTEYVYQVSLYDYNILKQLKTAREQVANLKMKLDKDLKTNEALQKEVNDQKDTIEVVLQEKHQQVSEYETSIEGQQEEVNKYARAQAQAEAFITAAEQSASTSANSTYTGGVFTWPVPSSNVITSYYGPRPSPRPGASSFHRGIDIACAVGADIVAASDGTVIVATYNYAEGNYVCIDHGGGVVTVYMHNSSLLVSVGQTVTAGQTIALGGSTGISTGPHCHFGVRVDGNYVDPMTYLQ